MGWTLLVIVPLMCAAAAHVWRYGAARLGRRVTWFPLLPGGAAVQWDQFRHVVASTSRRFGNGRVLIARFGEESTGAGSRIWLGIAGSKQPLQMAKAMARAAGAAVGQAGDPPWPDTPGIRWRMGYTEPAPGRKQRDATEEYLRALDTRTIPERPTFPDICSDYLNEGGAGEVFVAMVQPSEAPTRIRAACYTTAVGLDMSFTEAAELRRSFLLPSTAWLLAASAVASALLPGWPVVAVWGDTADIPASLIRIAVCVAVVAWAVKFLWSSLNTPPVLTSLLAGRSPRFTRKAMKGKLLPVWQLGEWATGDERAGVGAPMRAAPPEALGEHGAFIGHDPEGQECRLPDNLRAKGVISYGDPGGGKTTFALNLLAHDSGRRARGDPLSMFWIETKGEGAHRAARVMKDHGSTPLMIMGAVPEGPRLELVDRAKPAEAGRLLTEAIRYAFEADDIRQASADVLASALEASALFPAAAARRIGVECHTKPNMIEVAYRLLGGVPEDFALTKRVLIDAVPEKNRQGLERYYAMRAYDYDRQVEPARNKLKDLRPLVGLFEPAERQEITFAELLTKAQPTVLHLGRIGTEDAAAADQDIVYSDGTAARAAAISMYVLWHNVQDVCDGWQAAGRGVAIYSDELRDIAGFGKHDLEVVAAMADQGRSRGVLPVFATQRPDQLAERTRVAVDSFATQAYFKLRAVEAAEVAVRQLYEAYTVEQISALPPGYCALSIAAEGRTPAAFTLHPANL